MNATGETGSRYSPRELAGLFGSRLILADGSMGTVLESLAPEAAEAGRLALLPLEKPDLVESVHAEYFRAGAEMVETATFSASARDLAVFVEAGSREPQGGLEAAKALAYRLNKAAAEEALRAAVKCGRGLGLGNLRLVAGSIGPGDKPPSLGASTYAELYDSYLPQARGLADGGADLAIVETCQDPLQIKAALAALRSPEGGRGLPCIVSATVDEKGRMLTGTDLGTFAAIVSPFGPLALGLNCSGGPDELASSLESLAAATGLPLCFMPNAGLPCSVDGKTCYPFGPEIFADKVAELARRHGLAVVGGCCGTTPAHIAALNARLFDRPRARERGSARPALASLYRAQPIGPGLFKIGERANAAGSAAFAALVDAQDFEAMAEKALAQEDSGADALDLHLARAGRNEAEDLKRLARLMSSRAQAALCLDSSDPEVLAAALPEVGGRPILNSTSLENEEKARRIFGLAAQFGASVVCLSMDASGPAATVEDKVRIARALYDLATGEFRLPPSSLLFDPLTFTIAAGGDARATISAIPEIKKACPGALTVLGVGNISYGLPRSLRQAVTSIFLNAAMEAGLDAAIMDTAGVPAPESIDPALVQAASVALGLAPCPPGSDPLDGLLAYAAEHDTKAPPKAGQGKAQGPGSAGHAAAAPRPESPSDALKAALARGDSGAAAAAALALEKAGSASEIALLTAQAMAESGKLWTEGTISLPLVLRSAEAAKRALGVLASSQEAHAKGTIVVATVKGDLHDIGKNIASAILSCSGWRIVDLGIDVPAPALAQAANAESAFAVGLSGLLTRSLAEMKNTVNALIASGSNAVVLCGGAAASRDFVAREIEPLHPGRVIACPDAFSAIEALDAYMKPRTAPDSEAGAPNPATVPPDRTNEVGSARETGNPESAADAPGFVETMKDQAYAAPFLGAGDVLVPPFSELLAHLDRKTLFGSRWGYKRHDFPEAELVLESLLPLAEEALSAPPPLGPASILGYFSCSTAHGADILRIQSVQGKEAPALELPFPRESRGRRRCLTDFFRPEGDIIAFFAATAGSGLARLALELKSRGKLEDYWRLHGLGSALAEAAASWTHERISAQIREGGGRAAGRRYSFGFPACPGLEYQAPLLELLEADRIGLEATSGHQLDPEHSVTAFVIARPGAVYFEA